MKALRIPRFLVIAAVAVVALAAVGYAFRESKPNGGASGFPEPAYETDGDTVLAQIDTALGRQSTTSTTIEKTSPPTAADSSGGVASSNASAPVKPDSGSDSEVSPSSYSADGRKIVQTASLKLQVEGVGEGFEEVGRIATAAGGFVASSSFSYVGDKQVASASIRVPAAQYQNVLSQLRALGKKVDSEASNSSDVSEEYADLSARLRNLEATETQMLTLLTQARTINDILTVQDRINSVRSQIEQAKGRMQLLDSLSDMATISVHLRPVIAVASSGGTDNPTVNLGDKVSEAWDDSIHFLSEIAGGLITVVVFGWWVPLFAVPGYIVLRRLATRPRPELPDGNGASA